VRPNVVAKPELLISRAPIPPIAPIYSNCYAAIKPELEGMVVEVIVTRYAPQSLDKYLYVACRTALTQPSRPTPCAAHGPDPPSDLQNTHPLAAPTPRNCSNFPARRPLRTLPSNPSRFSLPFAALKRPGTGQNRPQLSDFLTEICHGPYYASC
jgi:hypothetical protein